ncbi:uncharacterized protein A4U43_UnF10020 [Asparagus officinalis]|uniref:Pentacotripeptide-repeat region of PRORP domain-containing protein n=1 Tax=Asparagus officinalis TaxID=4686 RepID=A0A1R3L5K0_ASPOF|nr:pentatricopeptide repeat-containing protein At2g29760, chloroplastic-like [Asparagus officinalis]ONK54890.1 uncharacterized protein A4U43_UnF10020 [Asparagus officinalis]
MEKRMIQILRKCRNLRELKQTHANILVHGLGESNMVLPKLIDLSSTFKSLDYATHILAHSHRPNTVVFNSMMKSFIERNHQNEAFLTYSKMRGLGIPPNYFTSTILAKACESMGSLEYTSGIHAQIIKCGFGCDVFVQNTLLYVYSNCGDLNLARQVFDEMLERDVVSWNSMVGAYMAHEDTDQAMTLFELMPTRNLISWNTLISALCKAGDMKSARSVFDRMPIRDANSWNAMITAYVTCNDILAARSIFDQMKDKDVVSWTAMISGYTKIGDMESARSLFDQMTVKNVISWNAMISGYSQNSRFDEALSMFQNMLLDGLFLPDEATLVSVVSACSQLGSLEHGNWVYSYIKKNNLNLTMPLGNALINMFSKCGDIRTAEYVFNQTTMKCVITWTTMVSGLAFNGQCREALALFKRMCAEGIEPDDIIFITVLSACSHGGLTEEGQEIFNLMIKHYMIKPRIEHYNCMIDLLGRAGKFEEAIEFIESMPFEPTAVIWATLLSFCSANVNNEFIEVLSQKIANLDPSNPGYRVLISNSSALKGRWNNVMEVRGSMRREGIEKMPGCSSIQIGREVHEFLVKDSKHKRRKEIYEALDELTEVMKKVRY